MGKATAVAGASIAGALVSGRGTIEASANLLGTPTVNGRPYTSPLSLNLVPDTAGTLLVGHDTADPSASVTFTADFRSSIPGTGAAFFKHIPVGAPTTHAVTIRQAGTGGSGTGSALNVTSDNEGFTALQLSGIETDRGTLKITHRYPGVSDASAAALSIDCQGGPTTSAQGIFVTATDGATNGSLLTLRNNSRDDFVVKGTGRVGIGVVTGATPRGVVDVVQPDDTSKGLYLRGNSDSALSLLEARSSADAVLATLSATGDLHVSGRALGQYGPRDHGLMAWAYDPMAAINSTVLTNGTVYLVRVPIASGGSATKVYWHVATIAVTPTASQNYVGVYDSTGARLATTNVDADITSTGLKTTTIASTGLTTGAAYWLAFVFNSATPPALARTSGLAGAGGLINVGLTAATYRFATDGTGQTSLPASFTPSSNAQGLPLWAAVGA
jgi:hypothetical protein